MVWRASGENTRVEMLEHFCSRFRQPKLTENEGTHTTKFLSHTRSIISGQRVCSVSMMVPAARHPRLLSLLATSVATLTSPLYPRKGASARDPGFRRGSLCLGSPTWGVESGVFGIVILTVSAVCHGYKYQNIDAIQTRTRVDIERRHQKRRSLVWGKYSKMTGK